MSGWTRFVLCECGWYDEPSFGNRWFTEQNYRVCPDCARSTQDARMVTARETGIFRRRLILRDPRAQPSADREEPQGAKGWTCDREDCQGRPDPQEPQT